MKKELTLLNQFRKRKEELTSRKKESYEVYLQQNEDLFDEMGQVEEKINELSNEIKSIALEIYEETGIKKQEWGVGIQIRKQLIYDGVEALSWAKNHNLALSLDKKAFENIAKNSKIDFVTTEEKTIATIPTDIQVG